MKRGKKLLRFIFVYLPAGLLALSLLWVLLYRIAPVMVRAVMASEDSRFMEHKGFAFDEIRKMRLEHRTKGKKLSLIHI